MIIALPGIVGAILLAALSMTGAIGTAPVLVIQAGGLLGLGITLASATLMLVLLWLVGRRAFTLLCLVVIGPPCLALASVACGLVHLDASRERLRHEIDRHRGVVMAVPPAGSAGVVPVGLLAQGGPVAAYQSVAATPATVPPVWWACARWLEDRDIGAPWHIQGVNVLALMRATFATLTHRWEGASTTAELVVRAVLEMPARPTASAFSELPRKLSSWFYGPAFTTLFAGPDAIAAAAATHLPLLVGAPLSGFGDPVHGVVRAAEVAFRTSIQTLSPAQAAILAAAIKRPLLMSPDRTGPGRVAAERRFAYLRMRADRCLSSAELPAGVDRAAARAALQVEPVPVLRSRQAAVAGAMLNGIPAELRLVVGMDWRNRVGAIAMPAGSLRLRNDFRQMVQDIERRHTTRLQVPLWQGPGRALVLAVVADETGQILVEAGNPGTSIATAGPQPIASLGKLAAAIVLGRSDQPLTLYPRGSTLEGTGALTAREAFARSSSPSILMRLAREPEANVAAAFAALGWPIPAPGSMRYEAVYGTTELRPDHVLRSVIALNGQLLGRGVNPPLPHAITAITLTNGRNVPVARDVLDTEPLRMLLTPRVTSFVTNVLAAPLQVGTMRNLAGVASTPGVSGMWGKTGSGDAADRQCTRVIWQVGGLSFRGRPMSFLVVVAGTNRQPLGHIEATAFTPLSALVVRAAIEQLEERGP